MYTGLRGGEVSNTLARGYEQCAQAEALRCTKRKRPGGGAFALLNEQRLLDRYT